MQCFTANLRVQYANTVQKFVLSRKLINMSHNDLTLSFRIWTSTKWTFDLQIFSQPPTPHPIPLGVPRGSTCLPQHGIHQSCGFVFPPTSSGTHQKMEEFSRFHGLANLAAVRVLVVGNSGIALQKSSRTIVSGWPSMIGRGVVFLPSTSVFLCNLFGFHEMKASRNEKG